MTWSLWITTERGRLWRRLLQSILEILLTEFMEPHGLTAYRLAKELRVPVPRINDIVRGKRAISADTALRLGVYFGLPAQFWLNLQNDYDLRMATKSRVLAKIRPRTKAA